MALAIDAVTNSGQKTNVNNWTWSHTCSGSNRLLVVSVSYWTGVTLNSVKYGGVNLNLARALSGASVYYLIAPAAGAANVVVNFSGNGYGAAGSVSFTDAHQTTPIGATNDATATGTSISLNITTSFNSSFLIDCLWGNNAIAGGAPSAGQTQRFLLQSGNTQTNGQSTKPAATTQSYSMGWGSFTTSNIFYYVVVEIKFAVLAPSLTTQAVSSAGLTSFTGNGTITDNGGQNATRRGFCYKVGISGDPTTADSVVYEDGDFGIGVYALLISGLSASEHYRVRAYATAPAGTGYGTTVQAHTLTPAFPIIGGSHVINVVGGSE